MTDYILRINQIEAEFDGEAYTEFEADLDLNGSPVGTGIGDTAAEAASKAIANGVSDDDTND